MIRVLLLTKTHLYGLTHRSYLRTGMVEISMRHPLNSIIKIATKTSSPELLSFAYGEKILKSSLRNSSSNNLAAETDSSSTATTQPADEADGSSEKKSPEDESAAPTSPKKEKNNNEYVIRGKEWFYVPDYAGEAASAVKMQIIEIMSLISQ